MGSDLNDLRVFQEAEALSQVVWKVVERWERFAKSTVGEQLVRAADSVGANIAEAYGRYHYADKIRILYIARGSLYETRFWLRQAFRRNLLTKDEVAQIQKHIDALPIHLNNFINALKKQRSDNATKEEPTPYLIESEIAQSPNPLISGAADDNPF